MTKPLNTHTYVEFLPYKLTHKLHMSQNLTSSLKMVNSRGRNMSEH